MWLTKYTVYLDGTSLLALNSPRFWTEHEGAQHLCRVHTTAKRLRVY